MRVLFTTPILEHPPAGGPQLRIENSIKALSRVCQLVIVSRASRASVGSAGERLYRSLSEGFHYAPAVANNRFLRRLRRLMFDLGISSETETSARFIIRLVDKLGIDVVWFGYGNISYGLISRVKSERPNLNVVCDTDSVWSRFVLRELPFQTDPAKRDAIEREGRRKEAEERISVDLCEITTAVSEVDAAYYRSIAREPDRVRIFTNAIDLSSYEVTPEAPADLYHPSMYLAGTFGRYDSPMDTAGRWILQEVLPRVRERIPDMWFYIVGRDSDTSFADLDDPRVVVKGKVPSVLPYLTNADVAIVPLKFESGTRFKILEAGACGIPLVSTVLGAEGLPVIDREHLLLADEPNDFASAIVELIRDRHLAERLSLNCRALVRNRYSVESLSQEASQILESLSK